MCLFKEEYKMKPFFIAVIMFLFCDIFSAQNLWQIKTDSVNFAVLISDYHTYEFEKAYFSVHEPSTNTENKLPIESIYNSPADYGDITFLYSVNNDTLFSGEIIWQGVGNIIFPQNFIPADSFSIGETILSEPLSFEYFTNHSGLDSTVFKTKADSAWDKIKNLDIVNSFSNQTYRVGIYLYTPGSSVEVDTLIFSDFVEAKWVTFLYVNNPGTSEIKDDKPISDNFELSQNYPNPFNPTTIISFTIPSVVDPKFESTTLKIYDILGNEVTTLVNGKLNPGNYKVEFNASNLSSGIYFYRIITQNFSAAKKMILVK